MLNSCVLVGTLKEIDVDYPTIRYLELNRNYSQLSQHVLSDKIALMNWNREAKGELFIYPSGAVVAIKGRIENFQNKTLVVVETLIYLGLNNS